MIQKDPKAFIIRVMIGGVEGEIDLSDPQYKPQVMAAAGRFASLLRNKKSGGTNGGRKKAVIVREFLLGKQEDGGLGFGDHLF